MDKLFTADQFTATKWSTTEDKAKFANHFVRFAESGFKDILFHKWFYNRLSMTFGHIAHFDRGGFYATWFDSLKNKLDFLEHTVEAKAYGDPAYTYCDVERVIQSWVQEWGILWKYRELVNEEGEKRESGVGKVGGKVQLRGLEG